MLFDFARQFDLSVFPTSSPQPDLGPDDESALATPENDLSSTSNATANTNATDSSSPTPAPDETSAPASLTAFDVIYRVVVWGVAFAFTARVLYIIAVRDCIPPIRIVRRPHRPTRRAQRSAARDGDAGGEGEGEGEEERDRRRDAANDDGSNGDDDDTRFSINLLGYAILFGTRHSRYSENDLFNNNNNNNANDNSRSRHRRHTRVIQTDDGEIVFERPLASQSTGGHRSQTQAQSQSSAQSRQSSRTGGSRQVKRVTVYSTSKPSVLRPLDPDPDPTGEAADMTCAICLEALHIRRLAALPCGHAMHEDCFKRWVVKTTRLDCPLCGQDFSKYDPDSADSLSEVVVVVAGGGSSSSTQQPHQQQEQQQREGRLE